MTGLIDWAGARRGPVLYDVASAVMDLGGTEHASAFLSTYQSEGPLSVEEMHHLDAFRRFRGAVQGAYFAGRLASNDLIGGVEQADNQKGLTDARRRLGALGFASSQGSRLPRLSSRNRGATAHLAVEEVQVDGVAVRGEECVDTGDASVASCQ